MAEKKQKSEKTSKKVASAAAKILKDPSASADVKSVAASALTQAADKKIGDSRPAEKLQLYVGVNFRADGDEEETRIEPGLIDLGVLPAAFENLLIENKKARIRLV